jgi:hypothetical protein
MSHGEAMALIAYYRAVNGKVATNIVAYVDRETCDKCYDFLPILKRYMEIKELVFVSKNGVRRTISDIVPQPRSLQ